MMDKKAKKELSNQKVKHCIEKALIGIKFVEFEEINIYPRLPAANDEEKIVIISQISSKDAKQLVKWITENLEGEQIVGDFYLLWSDREFSTPADWAKVTIENFKWIKKLWSRCHALYLLNSRRDTLWEIFAWEGKYLISRSNLDNTTL